MEPTYAPREKCVPFEIPWLQPRRGLIRAVVENHWCSHTMTAVAVNGGDIGPRNPVVIEPLIEGLDAHRPDSLGDEVANGIVHHRGYDAGCKAEAIRQVGGYIEFATADMNFTGGRLSKGNDSGVQAMHKGSE